MIDSRNKLIRGQAAQGLTHVGCRGQANGAWSAGPGCIADNSMPWAAGLNVSSVEMPLTTLAGVAFKCQGLSATFRLAALLLLCMCRVSSMRPVEHMRIEDADHLVFGLLVAQRLYTNQSRGCCAVLC